VTEALADDERPPLLVAEGAVRGGDVHAGGCYGSKVTAAPARTDEKVPGGASMAVV
jgi:hypothetical protein